MIREITHYIENQMPLEVPFITWTPPALVFGVNLFVGHIPIRNINNDNVPADLTNQRYVAVLENAGGAVDNQQPDMIDKAIQIYNQADSYFGARKDAMDIFMLLHRDVNTYGAAGIDLPVVAGGPNWLAMVIDAVSVPAPIQNPDAKGNFIFSTNYIFRMEKAIC